MTYLQPLFKHLSLFEPRLLDSINTTTGLELKTFPRGALSDWDNTRFTRDTCEVPLEIGEEIDPESVYTCNLERLQET